MGCRTLLVGLAWVTGCGPGAITTPPEDIDDSCIDNSDCDLGKVCAPLADEGELRFACQATGVDRFVGEDCTGDDDCRSLMCEGGVCTEPCGGCPGFLQCTPTTIDRGGLTLDTGVCVTQRFEWIEAGMTVTPAAGPRPTLNFTIPPLVESFVIVATSSEVVDITRLVAPDGAVFYDENDDPPMMYPFAYWNAAAMHVPGTDDPAGAVQAGTYQVEVQTLDPNNMWMPMDGTVDRVAVVYKRSPHAGGLMDLMVQLAPGTLVTTADATTSMRLQNRLARAQDQMRALFGVSFGEIEYRDIPASYDILEDGDESRRMRTDHSEPGIRNNSVNLFLVEDITYGFVAVAGGLPGPPGVYGTGASGISTTLISPTTDFGKLVAHELGHWLGLFHTTEQGAMRHDTIMDTPECMGGMVSSCPDYQNIMFPFYLTASDPMETTPGQQDLVRQSPWLFELAYPDVCGRGVEGVDLRYEFSTGDTQLGSSSLQGSCATGSHPERVHVYRVRQSLTGIDIEVLAPDFNPVLIVYENVCGGMEASCEVGTAGTPLTHTFVGPAPGDLYIVVDGDDGSGRYDLSLRPVP